MTQRMINKYFTSNDTLLCTIMFRYVDKKPRTQGSVDVLYIFN